MRVVLGAFAVTSTRKLLGHALEESDSSFFGEDGMTLRGESKNGEEGRKTGEEGEGGEMDVLCREQQGTGTGASKRGNEYPGRVFSPPLSFGTRTFMGTPVYCEVFPLRRTNPSGC
jgi:hypothetical protein